MTDPIAYTDGACLGNPGPGGWGVRLLLPDGTVQELGGADPVTTNNRMELQGAIEALKMLAGFPRVTVVTDSRYVIDGVTRWIHQWRRRGWTTTMQTPVKNQALWQQLDALNHPGIRWRHVRGHTGDPNNERVDAIARAFAQELAPALFRGRMGSLEDPVGPGAPPEQAVSSRTRQTSSAPRTQYVSIVRGVVALDHDWPSCAARVQGVSGARYKKVRTRAELAAFCTAHGVTPPESAC